VDHPCVRDSRLRRVIDFGCGTHAIGDCPEEDEEAVAPGGCLGELKAVCCAVGFLAFVFVTIVVTAFWSAALSALVGIIGLDNRLDNDEARCIGLSFLLLPRGMRKL
jgi:hypothetical protein